MPVTVTTTSVATPSDVVTVNVSLTTSPAASAFTACDRGPVPVASATVYVHAPDPSTANVP